MDSKISTTNNFIAAKKLKLLELERTIDDVKQNLNTDQNTIKAKEDEITKLNWDIGEKQRDLARNLEQKESQEKNQDKLKDELFALEKTRTELSKETDQLLDKLKGFKLSSQQLEIENFQVPEIKALELEKSNLSELTQESEKLKAEIKDKHSDMESFKDSLNEVSSRLYGLETMNNNFEGFQTGFKSLMKQKTEAHPGGSFSLKPITEIVKVDKKYELAMEGGLGLKLQTLVASSHNDVLEAVDYLKTKNLGRSSFAASYKTKKKETPKNVIGMLSSMIETKKEYSDVIDNILDGVAVVENIDQAINLNKTYPDNTFVTLDGDVLSDGILTAGTMESAGFGILKRKREIQKLNSQKSEWQGKYYLAKESLKKKQEDLKKINDKIDSIKKITKEHEFKVIEAKMKLNTSLATKKEKLKSVEEKVSFLKDSILDLGKDLTDLDVKIRAANDFITESETQILEKKNSLSKIIETVSAVKSKQSKGINDYETLRTRN